jgi:curved DNA-binding protein CbpA
MVNHYEVLEVSPSASASTIEQVFRLLAKKNHPDLGAGADVAAYKQLVASFEVLRDPQKRSDYDRMLNEQKQGGTDIQSSTEAAADDCLDRYRMLSVLYAQRRKNYKKPGIGIGSLEEMVPFSPEVLQFHLWYFKEKGWVTREESGQLSISAAGVDYIESMNQPQTRGQLRIEQQASVLPAPTAG